MTRPKVLFKDLQKFRAEHDTDNVDALCSHCTEYRGSLNYCSDTCGTEYVFIDDPVMAVRIRLEGIPLS